MGWSISDKVFLSIVWSIEFKLAPKELKTLIRVSLTC